VLDHGHVVKLRGYGFADLESCVPATENTLFGIGSVSKQMTAVGILTLVRDGKLSLDDPITKYLPEGKGVWDAVHIRHLLTHTSGIPDIYGDDDKFPSMHPDRTASPSTPDLVKSFAIGKLNFAPGENWAYSNTGYVLLSMIAERVSGEPFPAFMHERVFAPLGMSSTRNYSPTELIPGRGTPYHIDDKGVATHGPFISDVFSHWGDTAFISTASDMSRWAQALGARQDSAAGFVERNADAGAFAGWHAVPVRLRHDAVAGGRRSPVETQRHLQGRLFRGSARFPGSLPERGGAVQLLRR